MRKRIFLTLVLSLCMADFGAFAATRGGSSSPAGKTVMAARAGRTQKVVAQPNVATPMGVANKTNTASADGNLQKRAATNTTKKVAGPQPMAARAGKTQKVVSNGTKVSEAVTNTAVPQECQNWFFGCMDSFCMVDNVNGARCQCSDRNAELQTAMEEIAKMDEQSYILATQGVERIKMGEKADAIIAAAKTASSKVTGKATDTTIGTSIKSKGSSIGGYQLDLSSLKSNIFAEEDDDDAFEVLSPTVDTSVINNALAKKGNELYTYSAKMCLTSNMPDACKSHTQILQSMYVQKIRSDCAAFENKLKQDKVASSEKLRTAEAALRSAALESYEDKNKYNLGGCVQEYAKCMKNECGSDYSKCMLLAAEENMKGGAGDKDARTISGVVDIVLSGSTMTQLMAKKTICDDEVLVHCENVRAQVWDKYIIGAATELKAAELAAEDDMRQNCIKTTAECFKNSCAASWDPKSDAANYDICLADPLMVYDSCKIKIEPCLVATGANNTKTKEGLKNSRLWSGVISMLASLRVDACTEELKAEIDKNCGKDFTYCIGLSTDQIVGLVAEAKLTACQDRYNDDQTVAQYIEQIAQGYMLQIDSDVASSCQKAVESAMQETCGATDSCQTAMLSEQSIRKLLNVQICATKGDKKGECYDDIESFGSSVKNLGLKAQLTKRPKMTNDVVSYDYNTTGTDFFTLVKNDAGNIVGNAETKEAVGLLNNALKMKMAVIENNPKVAKCLIAKTEDNKDLFPKLTQNAKITIADALVSNFWTVYDKELTTLTKDKIPSLTKQITDKLVEEKAEEKAAAEDKANDAVAETLCKNFEDLSEGQPSVHGCTKTYNVYTASYDKDTNTCAVVKKTMGRKTWCWCGAACPWAQEKDHVTKTFTSEQLRAGTASF